VAYEVISKIYDELMEEVDYNQWCDFMEKLFLERTPDIHHILELGCGSGIMTECLLNKGYEVVGVDTSEEMLFLAQERLQRFGNKVILMEQDIENMDFEIYEIDCIFSSNDTLNYILEEDKLKLIALLRTFFNRLHGYHIQYNVVSRETLIDAQKHPEKHRDLIVRVAGYSAFFNVLSKATQDDIIGRTEHTL